jgi:hypothetical protein
MGREIRRVPEGWEHPKDDKGHYKPMYDETFDEAFEEWSKGYYLWKEGKHPDQKDYPYQEWAGSPPDPEYYRPVFQKEATHYEIYETVSEGTPVSPVFSSLKEMEKWLISEGFSEFASKEFCNTGYAPSMVFTPGKGVSGIGIHALDDMKDWK